MMLLLYAIQLPPILFGVAYVVVGLIVFMLLLLVFLKWRNRNLR
jgi:hypothetical protein